MTQVRGRQLAAVLTTVATLVSACGTADRSTVARQPSPGPRAGGYDVPSASRVVGLGHVAVAVPRGWPTNRTRCGRPTHDTVIVDSADLDACYDSSSWAFDSLELSTGGRHVTRPGERHTLVHGVPVERAPTRCVRGTGHTRTCRGSAYVPSARLSVTGTSPSRATVDRLIATIHPEPDRVGVPGFARDAKKGADYVSDLRAAGLAARLRHTHVEVGRWPPPGYVGSVRPRPGTMVRPGTVVTVVVGR